MHIINIPRAKALFPMLKVLYGRSFHFSPIQNSPFGYGAL
ncbi:hypothetical protein MNB_SV-10-933 [hydrothermal vent metagenome]|uniref:Uncharacterized protein n=1 Tax=hydrothermal vent metagenome TaxID=652676 RepID=A0A1W1BKQ1_9ZZZZ